MARLKFGPTEISSFHIRVITIRMTEQSSNTCEHDMRRLTKLLLVHYDIMKVSLNGRHNIRTSEGRRMGGRIDGEAEYEAS